jgi:hypothetical protein
MSHNPELTRASNERRKWRDRIIGLSLSVESARANFSPGDDWLPQDDRVAFQIEQLHAAIDETADRLTRAAMAHRAAIDELETRREADRLAEE